MIDRLPFHSFQPKQSRYFIFTQKTPSNYQKPFNFIQFLSPSTQNWLKIYFFIVYSCLKIKHKNFITIHQCFKKCQEKIWFSFPKKTFCHASIQKRRNINVNLVKLSWRCCCFWKGAFYAISRTIVQVKF